MASRRASSPGAGDAREARREDQIGRRVGAEAKSQQSETVKAVRVSDIVVAPNRMRALRPEKVDEIAESIRAQRRLLQLIVVRPRGRGGFWLVAGWHRLEAARALDLDSVLAVVRDDLDADAALLVEIDENLIRADLSPAERAMCVARRKELYERVHPETKPTKAGGPGRGKTRRHSGDDIPERFTKDTARKTRRSERSVQREVERANKIVSLADVVGTSLDAPDELDALAKLPEPAQADLIARAKAGKKVTARHEAKLLRRKERELELADATIAASQALGKKLYGVIYADPPWRYQHPPMGATGRSVENEFRTMVLDEIKAVKVPAAKDCVLFLWTPFPHLAHAIEVVHAWGFEQKSGSGWRKLSGSGWRKPKKGTGYWVLSELELLLICTRGTVPAPAEGEQFPGFIEAPRRRHSEKPDIFAEEIARLFPNVPKLEMFARKRRPGWDYHGNELLPEEEAAE
jgi:N6-adenosine-specific RNA methylase IME4